MLLQWGRSPMLVRLQDARCALSLCPPPRLRKTTILDFHDVIILKRSDPPPYRSRLRNSLEDGWEWEAEKRM
uniref:Uncharacterized protein n=1 Tax=Physcomitrium patens TaxID=3218 RepID=A0A2K1JGX4_PHYPA|nr:hypothetical protein PHYPA_018213 [Physcomitrium patens]